MEQSHPLITRVTAEHSDPKREKLFTLPTLISLVGLGLTLKGAEKMDTPEGLGMMATGRICDLADGACARALDQESNTGAWVDAIADKAGMATTLVTAWQRDLAPKPVLAGIILSNALNASLMTAAMNRDIEARYQTPKSGKYSMALFNVSVGAYSLGEVLRRRNPDSKLAPVLKALALISFGSGAVLAVPTAKEYYRRAKGTK